MTETERNTTGSDFIKTTQEQQNESRFILATQLR